MNSKRPLVIALALYVVSAAASFGAFSYFGGSTLQSVSVAPETTEEEQDVVGTLLTIDPSEPKDQACPLNGKMYTKTEKEAWEKKRPLAVMIENTPDARPQSGVAYADVVFEAIAEGGVTRFMGMFYCGVQVSDTTLAPIRSARSYFIDWASGFNLPLYVHVGGANLPGPADALGQLSDYGWVGENDLNQFSIGYPTFVRDYNRVPGKDIATEHTMVTTTEKLWAVGEKRGWTNMSPDMTVGKKTVPGTDWKANFTGWTFEDKVSDRGDKTSIAYEFWTGYKDYAVSWQLNTTTGLYERTHGGEKHLNLEDQQPVAAANVVVLLTEEKGPIDEKKHMLYGTTGKGDALVFKNGNVIKATWNKKTRESELSFTDSKGKAIEMARGLTWISVVSDDTEVTY